MKPTQLLMLGALALSEASATEPTSAVTPLKEPTKQDTHSEERNLFCAALQGAAGFIERLSQAPFDANNAQPKQWPFEDPRTNYVKFEDVPVNGQAYSGWFQMQGANWGMYAGIDQPDGVGSSYIPFSELNSDRRIVDTWYIEQRKPAYLEISHRTNTPYIPAVEGDALVGQFDLVVGTAACPKEKGVLDESLKKLREKLKTVPGLSFE